MTLAFYKVDNSQCYERHTFDMFFDRPQVIREMLCKLSDDEIMVYDMNHKYDVGHFENDYNDEKLDGGWWCVVIYD